MKLCADCIHDPKKTVDEPCVTCYDTGTKPHWESKKMNLKESNMNTPKWVLNLYPKSEDLVLFMEFFGGNIGGAFNQVVVETNSKNFLEMAKKLKKEQEEKNK
jgi:hypothetical protein